MGIKYGLDLTGGERARPPSHPAIYESLHGLCCGAFLAGAFLFFCLRVLAQKMSYFVISGPVFLKNVDILSDFAICRKFGI